MSYYKKQKQPDIIETILMSIGRGLWFIISWPFKKLLGIKDKGSRFNKVANLAKWAEIENMIESGDEIHAKQAIIEADKFFENILQKAGSHGVTFADKLKNYENHFNHEIYQSIWDAHKVRNKISHEMEYKLSIEDAKSTLNKFKRGLNSLGAI